MVYFCCLSVDDFIGGKIFMYLVTIWVLLISYFVLCSVELLNVCCEIVLAEDGLFHEVCNGVHSCFAGGAKDVVVFFSKLRCTFFLSVWQWGELSVVCRHCILHLHWPCITTILHHTLDAACV